MAKDRPQNTNRIVQFKKDFKYDKIAGMNFKAGDIVEMDPISAGTISDMDPDLVAFAPEGTYMSDIKAEMAKAKATADTSDKTEKTETTSA